MCGGADRVESAGDCHSKLAAQVCIHLFMASTIWRGHLAFGLVSFPVRLYRAARAEKVSLRRLYRPASSRPSAPPPQPPPAPEVEPPSRPGKKAFVEPPPPPAATSLTRRTQPEPEFQPRFEPPAQIVRATHNTVTADSEDEPVSRNELVKGYEFDKGQYVVLEDEELKSITPQTTKEMQIVEFVRLAEIDPIFYETSYYVAPDEVGERPYSLLYEALKQTEYVGLGQLAMHSREHVVVIRPGRAGLVAHTMFYPDEVRAVQEFRVETTDLNSRELDLAKRLIDTMVVPFEPEKFRDTYRDKLQEMIASKISGREVAKEAAPAARTSQVIDIMQALQESLKMAKKPAARSEAPPAVKTAESTRRRRG